MPNQSTFYFAWVGSDETTFDASHMREDELIFAFELNHEEGQFAELELEILNPHVGLLAPGRPLWAWFSWSDGSNVYPLFFGRLIGLPDDLFEDAITVKLVAKPLNYFAQRAAVAASLRVLPFYDPVFIDEAKLEDPDAVLEGYSALWHVDRVTHQVTISDIITGEDGIVDFPQHEVFHDEVSLKLSGAPLMAVEIEAEIEWTQCDKTGKFEMKAVQDMIGDPNQLKSDGYSVMNGMSVKTKESKDPTQTSYSWEYKNVTPGPHQDGDLMEEKGSTTVPFYGGELTSHDESRQFADKESGTGEEYSIKESYKETTEQPGKPSDEGEPPPDDNKKDPKDGKAEIAVEVEQDRKEGVYVAMLADVQPVLATLNEDEEEDLIESLSMNARDAVDAGAGSSSQGVYFSTDRGMQSVEYLLMVARSHLLAGSRVVEVEWESPFQKLVYSNMSCRKNAAIEDPRLPGTTVFGKVVSYGWTGDGDDGEFIGKVTINSAVGNGDVLLRDRKAVTADAREVTAVGTPVYVAEGYVDIGYQHYSGRYITAATGDVSFEGIAFEQVGIQFPVTSDQLVLRHEYHNAGGADSPTRQLLREGSAQLRSIPKPPPIGTMITQPPESIQAYGRAEIALNNALSQSMNDNPSWVEIELRPVQKISTVSNYQVGVTPLVIPKQIDLSAS